MPLRAGLQGAAVNNDQRLAEMFGQLCLSYIAQGDSSNAAILAARAAHYAALYAVTGDWQRKRGAARLLWAILKGW